MFEQLHLVVSVVYEALVKQGRFRIILQQEIRFLEVCYEALDSVEKDRRIRVPLGHHV